MAVRRAGIRARRNLAKPRKIAISGVVEAAVQRLGASSCRFNARILRRYCALTTAHAPRLAGGDFGPIQNNNRHRRRAKGPAGDMRSEEHTSELQSLMRISYAVFCLKKKKTSHDTEVQPVQKN